METVRDLWRFLLALVQRFRTDEGFQLSGSLAFTTILSIVPAVTVGFSIFSALPGFLEFSAAINRFLAESLLPERITRSVLAHIDEFTQNTAGLTTLGLLGVVLSALILVGTIERAFDKIWRVRHPRAPGLRVVIYWGVMTLGPILVGASLWISSYLVQESLGLVGRASVLATVLATGVPLLIMVAAFSLLYALGPGRYVAPRHAVIGGAVAAVLFELAKYGFALYVTEFAAQTLYGTFAVVPIFLLWIYLSWVVTIIGAEIAALAPDFGHLHGLGRTVPPAYEVLLPMLRALLASQRQGRPITARQLAREAGLASDLTETELERLGQSGWVVRSDVDTWALAFDPNQITIAQIAGSRSLRDDAHSSGGVCDLLSEIQTVVARPVAVLAPAAPRPQLASGIEEGGTQREGRSRT